MSNEHQELKTTENVAAETCQPQRREVPTPRVVTRPRIDIHETDSAYVLFADMPGVDEKSAEVLVEKQILTIKGEAELFQPEGFEQVYRESNHRYYERLIRLPEEVDPSQLEAAVKNGVLRLHLPKTNAARTIRVQVNAG